MSFSWAMSLPIVVLPDPSPEDVAALGDRTVVELSADAASVAGTIRAALAKG